MSFAIDGRLLRFQPGLASRSGSFRFVAASRSASTPMRQVTVKLAHQLADGTADRCAAIPVFPQRQIAQKDTFGALRRQCCSYPTSRRKRSAAGGTHRKHPKGKESVPLAKAFSSMLTGSIYRRGGRFLVEKLSTRNLANSKHTEQTDPHAPPLPDLKLFLAYLSVHVRAAAWNKTESDRDSHADEDLGRSSTNQPETSRTRSSLVRPPKGVENLRGKYKVVPWRARCQTEHRCSNVEDSQLEIRFRTLALEMGEPQLRKRTARNIYVRPSKLIIVPEQDRQQPKRARSEPQTSGMRTEETIMQTV